MHAEPACPHAEDAAAFVADELVASERVAFEAHLAKCERCAAAVRSIRSVVLLLHSTPQEEVAHDLAPAVLTRAREERSTTTWTRVAAFAAAAAVVFAFVLSKTWSPPIAPPPISVAAVNHQSESVARALDWLCKAQEADGSWSTERWGGDQRFAPALTALPLIALLSNEHSTPEQSAAAARAVQSLQNSQAANGSFGGAFFGSSYNQGIATLALLRAYQRHPAPALKRSIESACAVIVSTQATHGGWGYHGSSQPHPAITLWNVEALKLAATLGIAKTQPGLDRGTQWQQTLSPAATSVPHTHDVDFYQAYFLASLLKQSNDTPSLEKLAAIREALLTSQVRDGSESGSWAPDDQWGRVGGRLYSTSLASLALE